jgi:hypothetical protein
MGVPTVQGAAEAALDAPEDPPTATKNPATTRKAFVFIIMFL